MLIRNRNRLLLFGLLLFAILAYRFAFSKTIDAMQKVATLESQDIELNDLVKMSSNLNGKEKHLDSILDKNNLKNTSVQNNLSDFLNRESSLRSFRIVEFSLPHSAFNDGVNTTSYKFILQGDYKELETTLYKLEQETGYGKIIPDWFSFWVCVRYWL